MKELEISFRLNGLRYTLMKRNERVAMFGIGGTFTDDVRHWEICKIQIRNDRFGIRESVPQNDLFGRDGSRCFADEGLALDYFDEFSKKLCQRIPVVESWVEGSNGVISEYS